MHIIMCQTVISPSFVSDNVCMQCFKAPGSVRTFETWTFVNRPWRVLEYGARAPVSCWNRRVQTREYGFPRRPTESCFFALIYGDVRKPPGTHGYVDVGEVVTFGRSRNTCVFPRTSAALQRAWYDIREMLWLGEGEHTVGRLARNASRYDRWAVRENWFGFPRVRRQGNNDKGQLVWVSSWKAAGKTLNGKCEQHCEFGPARFSKAPQGNERGAMGSKSPPAY